MSSYMLYGIKSKYYKYTAPLCDVVAARKEGGG
jgi:hypothetical protein